MVQYIINDNTGRILVTDCNPSREDFEFKYDLLMIIRQLGYVRIQGEIVIKKTGNELKINSIVNVTDHNELINHWLYVAMTHCMRIYGPLSEDELKSTDFKDNIKTEGTSEKEKSNDFSKEEYIINAIKNLKEQGSSLQRDDIHDAVNKKIQYADFLALINEMVKKQILVITDKDHYDLK